MIDSSTSSDCDCEPTPLGAGERWRDTILAKNWLKAVCENTPRELMYVDWDHVACLTIQHSNKNHDEHVYKKDIDRKEYNVFMACYGDVCAVLFEMEFWLEDITATSVDEILADFEARFDRALKGVRTDSGDAVRRDPEKDETTIQIDSSFKAVRLGRSDEWIINGGRDGTFSSSRLFEMLATQKFRIEQSLKSNNLMSADLDMYDDI